MEVEMTWRVNQNVSIARTDFGAVLLDETSGSYWQLNPTGLAITDGLLAQQSAGEISSRLAEQYGIDPGQARADVDAMVEQLVSMELLIQ
jgi:hypothetical protein